jgi:CRP/FNR family transcriptional regulator, anaerobic regulatory protein
MPQDNYLLERFAQVLPFFERMPQAVLQRVLQESRVKSYAAGSSIPAAEGGAPIYSILLHGAVRVVATGQSGREILLYRVEAGEGCALMATALFGKAPRPTLRIADGEVEILELPAEVFHELLGAHEPFRNYVLGIFATRLIELSELVEAVAFQKLDQRLAALLLARGRTVRVTHEELARELGSVREIVSRLLRSFADKGVVVLQREQIEVRDPRALRRIANGSA